MKSTAAVSPAQGMLAELLSDAGAPVYVYREKFPVAKLPAVIGGKEPTPRFIESVRRDGLTYPLIVEISGRVLKLRDGRRRLKTVRFLGLKTVPVRFVEVNPLRGSALGLVLNEQRSANPAADLLMIKELLAGGADEQTIADSTGMPLGRIRRILRLATLPPKLAAAFAEGVISSATAEKLAKMSQEEQRRAEDLLTKEGQLSCADVLALRRAAVTVAIEDLPLEFFTGPAANAPMSSWRATLAQAIRDAVRLVPAGEDECRAELAAIIAKLEPAPAAAAA